MIYNIASVVHIVSAIASLVLGLSVIVLRKGTRLHQVLGYGYFIGMLGTNLAAFLIYQLSGRFGAFHIAAIASLITLVAGFIPVFFRRPRKGWLELHFQFMSWSYVGLLAAGFAEAAVRLPAAPFWPAVAISTLVTFILGGIIIFRYRPDYIPRP